MKLGVVTILSVLVNGRASSAAYDHHISVIEMPHLIEMPQKDSVCHLCTDLPKLTRRDSQVTKCHTTSTRHFLKDHVCKIVMK